VATKALLSPSLSSLWGGEGEVTAERGAKFLNSMAVLPFPLPALLKQYRYIKRGERVRVRWACSILCNVRVYSAAAVGGLKSALRSGNIAFATGVNSVINLA